MKKPGLTTAFLWLAALNEGLRKDQIVTNFELPDHFATHPLLIEQYVSAGDICKMVIRQYTGWWDDIPSYWSPASRAQQGQSIVNLSGGMEGLLVHVGKLKNEDLALAAHFVDWAYYAEPNNPKVLKLAFEIYKSRILAEGSVTQEMLVYLDHMTEIRAKM